MDCVGHQCCMCRLLRAQQDMSMQWDVGLCSVISLSEVTRNGRASSCAAQMVLFQVCAVFVSAKYVRSCEVTQILRAEIRIRRLAETHTSTLARSIRPKRELPSMQQVMRHAKIVPKGTLYCLSTSALKAGGHCIK
jgi:hypothetical protein